MIEDTQV